MTWLDRFTTRRYALTAIAAAIVLAGVGLTVSHGLKIGDLDPAPELRADSRYNQDNAYITANYALSSDQFAVIVKTDKEGCLKYPTLVEADRLAWALKQVPGLQTTVSLADAARQITAGSFEGNPKWLTINRNQDVLNYAAQQASTSNPDLFNTECSVMPVIAYLSDHKAETLDRVVSAQPRSPTRTTTRMPVPARGGQCRDRGGDQYCGSPGESRDAAVRVRGGHRAVLHHLPQLACRDRRGRSARAHVDPVRSADGRSRHRGEGGDAARYRARRGHRSRLCAVPALGAARAAARRRKSCPSL
jgi:hypothetical protein